MADEKGLFLPELEYMQQRTGQDADAAESETNPNMEDTRDSPQDLPVVSRSEVEDYLTSLYSKSVELEIQADPEILNRFTLDKLDKEEFSLVYDPNRAAQSKKLIGLPSPYGISTPKGMTGRVGSLNPEWASPQPLGQTSARIQIKDLTPWADQVLEKIERNWVIDPSISQGITGTVGISVTVAKSGEITFIEVTNSSGNQTLDSSAKNAVERSIPLPSLPIMYPSKTIVITIEFEY